MTGAALPAEVVRLHEVDSTNAEARRWADAGERGPLWITAVRQTAGRGRRGRSWETGEGNLAATLLTSTAKPPAEAAAVAFVAALAVFDLVAAYAPEGRVQLKWPNDVLLAGAKVSGVLVESGARAGGGLWLAVGVGVNLLTPPEAPERPATALANHLRAGVERAPSPQDALERLAEAFGRWWTAWETHGFEPIRQAWTDRAVLERPCTVRLDRETLEGVAEGLEPDGALRLRMAGGEARRVTAGDVFFPQGAP